MDIYMLCYLRPKRFPDQCLPGEYSPLLSSCLVCVISVKTFLLLLFIVLECIKSNRAQGEGVKGMETQLVSSEGEILKEEWMNLANQHRVLQLRLVTGIWLL